MMPLSPGGPCTCATGSLSQLLLPAWPSRCCGRQLAPCLPKDAKRRNSGTSKSTSTGTVSVFRQGPCPAGCTPLGEEVGWAPWPPLPRIRHPRHCSGVPAPGNCPRSSFGGIALPSADLPTHGQDTGGASWLGEWLWPSPRTSFSEIPTQTSTFAHSGVRTGYGGRPAGLKASLSCKIGVFPSGTHGGITTLPPCTKKLHL